MKLHDHKWHVVANRVGRIWARCKITCRVELDLEQIDAMLNEHAALKRGVESAHLHLLASICECGEPLKETDAFDVLDALLTIESAEKQFASSLSKRTDPLMVEIREMANGWLVSAGGVMEMRYPQMDKDCFVFNGWDDLVVHIKKELALAEETVGRDDCKSSS